MCLCVNTNVTSSHSEGGTTGGWEGEDARERERMRERERERERVLTKCYLVVHVDIIVILIAAPPWRREATGLMI